MNELYFLDNNYLEIIEHFEYIKKNLNDDIKLFSKEIKYYINKKKYNKIYNLDEILEYYKKKNNNSIKKLKKLNKIKKIKNNEIKKLNEYIFYYEYKINEIYYMINTEGICSTEIFMAEDSIKNFIKKKRILIKKLKELKKINK